VFPSHDLGGGRRQAAILFAECRLPTLKAPRLLRRNTMPKDLSIEELKALERESWSETEA